MTVSEEEVPVEEEPLSQEAPVAPQSQSPAIDMSDVRSDLDPSTAVNGFALSDGMRTYAC